MGLLDSEIKSKRSECVRKPEWALCIYCKVPFLTSTFDKECRRCSHFVQYKIEFTSKIMIINIICNLILVLAIVLGNMTLKKLNFDIRISFIFDCVIAMIQGCILWKIVKIIINNKNY